MSRYRPVYLDYLASTPVDPRVAGRMAECLTLDGVFGNPASRSHVYGWRAEEVVEDARRVLADLINADPREIVWTSGATESDNLAIKGVARHELRRGRHLVTSAIEHKAVLDSCQQLESEGFEITRLRPDPQGRVDVRSLEAAIRPDTVLVSLMHVNNELGTINDLSALGRVCRARGVCFHVDAAQSLGKLPIDLGTLPVDLMSFSAHKLYGPKGIGALFVRRDPQLRLEAQMHGGGHERGMRSGTLATHQIAGFGEAARIAGKEMSREAARIAGQRERLWGAIGNLGGVRCNAEPRHCIPGALNLCFEGLDGEALMSAMKDLAISSGSACNSASIEPSYVLKGIGLSDEDAHASLRFGIGRFTDDEDIELAIAVVGHCVRRLRDAA